MPKKRLKQNRHLPERWCMKHGAYYYQVPPGLESEWDGKKWFRLGKTFKEAFEEWVSRVGEAVKITTVNQLFLRYFKDEVPNLAPRTQSDYKKYSVKILKAFGHMRLTAIKPHQMHKYRDIRTDSNGLGKVQAQKEISLLSAALTQAVQWGYIDTNPLKGHLKMKRNKPRKRYIEDWEVEACFSLKAFQAKGSVAMMQAYIKLKLLTGLRKGDMLRLKKSNLTTDGIETNVNKTSQRLLFEWNDLLKEVVDEVMRARPVESEYLFCTRRGVPYVKGDGNTSGFDSIWHRYIDRCLEETKLEERFTEHDLRAKAASDAPTDGIAQALLGHTNRRTTVKIYRRSARIIKTKKEGDKKEKPDNL